MLLLFFFFFINAWNHSNVHIGLLDSKISHPTDRWMNHGQSSKHFVFDANHRRQSKISLCVWNANQKRHTYHRFWGVFDRWGEFVINFVAYRLQKVILRKSSILVAAKILREDSTSSRWTKNVGRKAVSMLRTKGILSSRFSMWDQITYRVPPSLQNNGIPFAWHILSHKRKEWWRWPNGNCALFLFFKFSFWKRLKLLWIKN